MSRLGPTGRLAALAMAVALVFALAGSGVGTDARLGDSEVANVPVVVFGAAPDDQQSDLVGTPLTLTFEGLSAETADWPDGFTAVADDTGTASFSVVSTVSTVSAVESNETPEPPAEPVYVVRVDSVASDSVQFTLAGGEQMPATVAVNGDLLAGALGLSAFDPAVVELRIDGVVTGYDTTAAGTVQFQTLDWADRTVTFRVVESEVPVKDPSTETPTAPGEEPNGTTEVPTEDPNSTTESPTEGPSDETPTEEAPTEETPAETPTDSPTEETPTEETPTEETPTEETPTEETPTEETPTEETPTEETPADSPTEEAPTDPSSESTETTESESPAPETTNSASSTDSTDTEESQTPDEADE